MLSIGEFSKVTQLSIKALRFYHKKGILVPDKIDSTSNYRYYDNEAVEKAIRIKMLKNMGFSLEEIRLILLECTDDEQLINYVQKKLNEIKIKLKEYKNIKQSLVFFINNLKENEKMKTFNIEKETISDMIICSIRYKGRYSDIGEKFRRLGKKVGIYYSGKPFALYYDNEYKEENADIEACLPVKKMIRVDDNDITCKELKGGDAITLIHKGSYDTIGKSYEKIFDYIKENQIDITAPTREIYIKGPGMIFKGNPKKYLTKIVVLMKK